MKITNLTGNEILYSIDQENGILEKEKTVHVNDFGIVRFFHKYTSYSILEAGTSKVLKILSLLDDPFKLRKEYHIVVDLEIMKSQLCNPQQIVITSGTNYVDFETRTYYEYFNVQCDGKPIFPNRIYASETDKIKAEFAENSRKLELWNAIWNVLIEPLLFEIIGYFVLYRLFTFWIGTYAWLVIVPLIILNLFIELIVLVLKCKKKRITKFCGYLNESVIQENCYNNFSRWNGGLNK